jgi:hypothetical protein
LTARSLLSLIVVAIKLVDLLYVLIDEPEARAGRADDVPLAK